MIASLGDYIYAKSEDAIYVNLFVGSNTTIPLKSGNVGVKMETNYPWDADIKLTLDPAKKSKFKIYVRFPLWHQDSIASGGLYSIPQPFEHKMSTEPHVSINGNALRYKYENGYLVVESEWKKGDILKLNFFMGVNKIVARPELKQDSNRIAVQRGPIVYCIEGADNNGKAWNVFIPKDTKFETIDYKVLDESVKALTAEVPVVTVGEDGLSLRTERKKIIAIPYPCCHK